MGSFKKWMRSAMSLIARSKSSVVLSKKLSTSSTCVCRILTTSSSDFACCCCSRCMPNTICAMSLARGWCRALGFCFHLVVHESSYCLASRTLWRRVSAVSSLDLGCGLGSEDS
jgi:hypothetical protein